MRIRSTKPEFWRSERVASVSWDARLVVKGLESYVDDNGVGKEDIALIIGDLFQRDLIREPSRTVARVSEAISELESAGLLWRYEHEGSRLMYIAFWETIQRIDKPQPGRFPRPDGTSNYKDSAIRESLATPREPSRALAPGTGEQGNRGTGEQPSSSEVADAPSDREDVEALCEQLATRIEDNGSKRPSITKAWRDAARLMLDRDDRGYADAQALIDWCQSDNFWRTNILSMPKFRDQYDKLRLRAGSTDGQSTQTAGQIRTIDGKTHGLGEQPGPWTPLGAPEPGQTIRDQYHDHWREIGWDHERECWIEAAS